jgi:omega-6 fatty acid desaturase (delta-12 desaturase)
MTTPTVPPIVGVDDHLVSPATRGADESLQAVRAVIPPSCYERPTWRAALALARAGLLHVVALVGLALTDAWWLLVPLWVLAGLGVSGLFVLAHDASHGALLDSARRNRIVARLCMIPSAHVEAAWNLGHNRIHHGYTTRRGFDFVWHPLTPEEYRALGRVGRLRHRVEWSFLGAGLYFGRAIWWQKMMRFRPPERHRAAIRRDKLILVAGMGAAVAATVVVGWWQSGLAGAVWMPVKLLVVPFALFLQIIGWTVYVHHVSPEIRWWSRREWSQFKGQMESTTVLRAPALLDRMWFHSIFVHVPHHVDMRIPFHQLRRAADAIVAAYPTVVRTGRLPVLGYIRATRACKLYDFDAGRWLTYRATRETAKVYSPLKGDDRDALGQRLA